MDTHDYQLRREILLTNHIALILSVCLILLFILRRIFFAEVPGGLTSYFLCVGLITMLIPVLLNRLDMTTTGRLMVCIAPVVFIWYTYLSLMRDMPFVGQSTIDSLRIHLLSVSLIPYLVLDRKHPALLVLGILPTLVSLLFFSAILNQFDFGTFHSPSQDPDAMLMGSRTFVAYCIISISCFIFQSIITYNDELNRTILTELKSKSQLIKKQNQELVDSHSRLNEINIHLEDMVIKKTEDIRLQNEMILKYAYANAHHVRGPIARLLGLIQVSKLDTELDYRWFFEKVEHETKQVDQIIGHIARELNQIEHSNVPHERNNA